MDNLTKSSLNPKKYQRVVNKIVRTLNRTIAEDALWRGRFYIKQNYRYCTPYFDKSGLDTFYVFTLYDLKTGFAKDVPVDGMNFEQPFNGYKLWQALNHFIVNDCDVWRNEPELKADTTTYRKPKEAFRIEKYKMGTDR